MYKLKLIGKRMMRYFLPTNNINKINLYVAGIKVYLYHLAPHIGQKHFNILKSILYMEKSAIGQLIIFNKIVMS